MKDWSMICCQIRSKGFSMRKLNRACGRDVTRLAQGIVREPKHSAGEIILRIHAELGCEVVE